MTPPYRALCANGYPDYWFPEKDKTYEWAAKQVCDRCELRDACLNYAIDADEFHGIWGGMSRRERSAEQRRRERTEQEMREP